MQRSFRAALRGVRGSAGHRFLRRLLLGHAGNQKWGKSTGPVCHGLANPSAGVLFLQQAADNGGGGPTEGLILHNPQRLQLFCLTEIISAAFQTLLFVPGGDDVATGKAVLNQFFCCFAPEQHRLSDELKSKCCHYGGDLCDLWMLVCMPSRKLAHVASADFSVN